MPARVLMFTLLLSSPVMAQADDLILLLQQRSCPNCRLADVDLVYADLRDANLQRVQLQRASLGQARLDGADLSGADLSFTSMRGASLMGAKPSAPRPRKWAGVDFVAGSSLASRLKAIRPCCSATAFTTVVPSESMPGRASKLRSKALILWKASVPCDSPLISNLEGLASTDTRRTP